MTHEKTIVGKLYRVKLKSGRTWIFKSAYRGEYLTEFELAYCINAGGDDYFTDRIVRRIGCHVGGNEDILSLTPANENEIAIFNRKLGL